jgi:hypothetical protein
MMKLYTILPLLLSSSLTVDAFTSSSTIASTKVVSSLTRLQAASQIPYNANSRRSPTANPKIRDASKSVATKVVTQRERNAMQNVVIDPDYWLTISVAALCPLILWYHPCTFLPVYQTTFG